MSITGTVKFFNADKGYGFIAPENGGADAFVHISAVERAGMITLNQDQRISYELEQDRRGKMAAVNLQPARVSKRQPDRLPLFLWPKG
jgi:cold shock protein